MGGGGGVLTTTRRSGTRYKDLVLKCWNNLLFLVRNLSGRSLVTFFTQFAEVNSIYINGTKAGQTSHSVFCMTGSQFGTYCHFASVSLKRRFNRTDFQASIRITRFQDAFLCFIVNSLTICKFFRKKAKTKDVKSFLKLLLGVKIWSVQSYFEISVKIYLLVKVWIW